MFFILPFCLSLSLSPTFANFAHVLAPLKHARLHLRNAYTKDRQCGKCLVMYVVNVNGNLQET